jgi:hypothetical protein
LRIGHFVESFLFAGKRFAWFVDFGIGGFEEGDNWLAFDGLRVSLFFSASAPFIFLI